MVSRASVLGLLRTPTVVLGLGGGVDENFLCGAEESLKGPLLSPTRAVGSAWREAFIVGSRTVRASLRFQASCKFKLKASANQWSRKSK